MISVITAVFNRVSTIHHSIESVASQCSAQVEHVVVDGCSTDGTSDVISSYASDVATMVREPDNGIYDALNKGIRISKGDVIGFLHADDMFHDDQSLAPIESTFQRDDVDAVYSDLVYVESSDTNRIVRYWKSGAYDVRRFRRGWMPPHPTVYVRRSVYERYGTYLTDFGSGADYECMVRLMVRHGIRVFYVPKVTVKMRLGGASNASIRHRLNANRSDKFAWTINQLNPPLGLRFTKPLSKLPQYIMSPPKMSPTSE